ncbi:MAG: iron donor protein CyaY [Betaproteobacteria bacterium]
MTESEFIALVDQVLNLIGEALDTVDTDVDWQLNDGILEIDCGAGGKIIVNRHVPNRELWLATRGGGFHYRLTADGWTDTRNAGDLAGALSKALGEQSGAALALPSLPVA